MWVVNYFQKKVSLEVFDSVLNMILVSGLEERTKIPQEGEIKKNNWPVTTGEALFKQMM